MAGVYISGMEKPQNCYTCSFCDDVEGVCVVLYAVEHKWERTHSCPLVELPAQHGDLIDRDALKDSLIVEYPSVIYSIDNAPTIIPADKDGDE